jgi:hypothetical protein
MTALGQHATGWEPARHVRFTADTGSASSPRARHNVRHAGDVLTERWLKKPRCQKSEKPGTRHALRWNPGDDQC